MHCQRTSYQYGCVILLMTALCWPLNSVAQDAEYVLRTYEVGDLILNIRDRPYGGSNDAAPAMGGQFGGGGGGMGLGGGGYGGGAGRFGGPGGGMGMGVSGAAPAPADITIENLVRVITSTVASESWSASGVAAEGNFPRGFSGGPRGVPGEMAPEGMPGGGQARIESLGTALVVWQAPGVHAQIEELLKQVRKGSADRKTVTIDARWLMLNSDELDSLLVPEQEGVPQVDRKQLAAFTRRPGSIRGITNCYSSQLVYLVSGTMKNNVSSFIPVVGSVEATDRKLQLANGGRESLFRLVADTQGLGGGRDVGYQPIITMLNFGALLEIRPTLIPLVEPEPTAVVDLKSTVTVPGDPRLEQVSNAGSDELAPAIDKVAIETQEFATTLRMPLGKPILVGGLTHEPSSVGAGENDDANSTGGAADGPAGERPQLYLVLEVR